MQRYIPSEITNAEKQGFSAPDASWFKGDSMQYVSRTLLNGDARIYDWIDRSATEALVSEHLSGTKNRRLLIWSLLNVNEYVQQHQIES